MHSEKFTIIIPTRDRADTLIYALRTVTMQDFEALEIIVSDNCSIDATRQVIEANDDPRIVYLNTGRRVSMTQNWEFALEYATGDWIGYLGDDDGMLPGSVARAALIAAETGVELIRSRSAFYQWPSISGHGSGTLTVPIGGRSGIRDTGPALRQVLAGRSDYQTLPTIYNGGFVHRRAINRCRGADGRFFYSQIPDLYSSIVLSNLCDRFFWSSQPLAINGASRHSTGTSYFSAGEDGKAQRASKLFAAESNIPLHPSIPYNEDGSIPRSIQALLLESYLQARQQHPEIPAIDPALQLHQILTSAGQHEAEIKTWAVKFAAAQGIMVPAPSVAERRALALRRTLSRVYMDRLLFPTKDGTPIRNIHEASLVAGTALSAPQVVASVLAQNVLKRAVSILSNQ